VLGWLKKRVDPNALARLLHDPAKGKGTFGTRWYEHSGTGTSCGATTGFKQTLTNKTQPR